MDMSCVVTLQVEFGGNILSLDLIICDRLETLYILGTDFCDCFVDIIHLKLKQVELDNGTTIPIIRNRRSPKPQVRTEKSPEEKPLDNVLRT